MRRWIRMGLAATATLAGMIALTPAAHAVTGTGGGTPGAGATAPNPFEALPSELLTCIAAQVSPGDQVNFSQVCQQWKNAARNFPVSALNIKVVRTREQLKAALANAQASIIVIIPDEDLCIWDAPANPQTRITIFDTQTATRPSVIVRADTHVTVSGTAKVHVSGLTKVTASENAAVWASKFTKVTASDNAAVAVSSSSTEVIVHSSSVRLWVTGESRTAVQLDEGVNPTIITRTSDELNELQWKDMAQPC